MSGLVVEDVHAGYTGTDILRGVSVNVTAGECVGVLGPNGAGKSTLLRAMSGQLKMRAGRRAIDDEEASGWRAHKIARAGVRWVGEPRPIFPSLTVTENLEIGGIMQRPRIETERERVYELLPALREKQAAAAGSLSGGQQQMLAIGQALMSSPRYLLLDEPSLGLAPQIVEAVADVITELVARGVGVVWAEQFPRVALKRCSRVVVLSAGSVFIAGPASEITPEQLEAAYMGNRRESGTAPSPSGPPPIQESVT
jgi:branched-chain amino acid transport system ATP-binding protein